MIIFTSHAIKRCRQGNINIQDLSISIMDEIPLFEKEIYWKFKNGLKAFILKKGVKLIVITIVPRNRVKNTRTVRYKDGTFFRIK